jgi:hypothetical protein
MTGVGRATPTGAPLYARETQYRQGQDVASIPEVS